MPDIFKKQNFVESEDSVQIPDVSMHTLMGLDLDLQQEEWAGGAAPEGEAQGGAELRPRPGVVLQPRVLTRQELEEIYADELTQIRQDAAEQAYQEALQQKRGELKECISQVEEALNELQICQEEFIEQYSKELQNFAVDIAEKIMLLRIAEDDMSLRALVLQTISAMKRSKWLSVDLSERLVNLVGFMTEEVKKAEYHGRAEINPIACPDDTVRVNTDDGTIVATISVQTDHLREAFHNADRE